jgi:formylglycine-generating enzyme required for sulfatase activity
MPWESAAVTQLAADTWENGNLAIPGVVHWYKFTANSTTQFLHAAFNTLSSANGVYVQVYSSAGTTVGGQSQVTGTAASFTRNLTSGQEYYIRVWAYSSGNTGTYQIGYNTSIVPPGVIPVQLAANTWGSGNLAAAGTVQWYKFTANSSTQYIHAAFGTLSSANGIYIQVYSSTGSTVGTQSQLKSGTASVTRSLSSGQEYYIRAWAYTTGDTGTFQLGYNTTSGVPEFTLLTENAWSGGNLTSGAVQWFTFTANSTTQYIHAAFDTLNAATGIKIQVLDSAYADVDTQAQLKSGALSVTRALTSGQTYYIKVEAYSSGNTGTYRIGYNTTFVPPGVIALTENAWSSGNLAAADAVQWFRLTATAATQYIHADFTTLDSANGVYVQVYGSAAVETGDQARMYSGALSAARTLTIGQTYYIKVWAYTAANTGTYRIGYNAAFVPPGVIELPPNVRTGGNISVAGSAQWFRLTAMGSAQYIHAAFGTLSSANGIYMQVYDSTGSVVEAQTQLKGGADITARALTAEQTYYIKVWAYTAANTGTYQLAYTYFDPTGATQLNEGLWGNGSLTSGASAQWFRFTASAGTHYIHTEINSLNTSGGVYAQVYDASGAMMGNVWDMGTASYGVCAGGTSGQQYYIRVWAYTSSNTGTYRVLLNKTSPLVGEMVAVEAGTFSMGSPAGEPNRQSNETQHSVTLTQGFLMAKYQVTQELYQAVVGSNPSSFTTGVTAGEVQAKRPVEYVNWYSTLVFCNKLSIKEGFTPVYTISGRTDPSDWGTVPTSSSSTWNAATADWNANGYRLPTEAEWEYACRAGSTTAYNLGDSWNGDWGWYTDNSSSKTHEVGKKTPNAWGLYDMHGNVWEWCWDWYGENYYTASGAGSDPRGPSTGSDRVSRGGSWSNDAQYLRSA